MRNNYILLELGIAESFHSIDIVFKFQDIMIIS